MFQIFKNKLKEIFTYIILKSLLFWILQSEETVKRHFAWK